MNIDKTIIGKTPQGNKVELFTLTNGNGLKVKIMTYGATITSVEVPDRHGRMENVTLSLETLDDYIAGHAFFGSTVGRFANRIGDGKFTLDGAEYTLPLNSGSNHLHGGDVGFDKLVWKAEPLTPTDSAGVKFSLESPDGDQGYPGTLLAGVTYSLTANDELVMDYTAETDKPTVVNLTNHTYWNLGGPAAGDVLGHELTINAPSYLPVDEGLIPIGAAESVEGTPMDFTTPHTIGERIEQAGGYDHCYLLTGGEVGIPAAAKVVDPKSGRVMDIYTTQPGIQLYSSNHLDGEVSAFGVTYGKHHGLCLETQHYPDSPNKPHYPTTVLHPGEKYQQTTLHKFSTK